MDFKLPKRNKNSHKGTFGKVLNIAGSKYMPGAAYLSSVSALKIGCGYCFLAASDDVIKSVASQTQNIVFVPISDIKINIATSDVIAIGCGITTGTETTSLFLDTIKNIEIPTVIDADGLNILAKNNKIELPERLILTPHPTEAARLLGTDTNDVLNNREDAAKKICEKYNATTVLKGHNTIVCSKGHTIYVNKTGNSALAKAGSGDVLTGMISGLLAQGMGDFEACQLGVYLHGLCGDLAAKDLSEYSVMAADLIDYIPLAIANVKN